MPIGGGGERQCLAHVLDCVVECRQGDPIGRFERVDHPGHRPAGRHHLPAPHAAGAVDQKEHIARHAWLSRLLRRHHHECKRAVPCDGLASMPQALRTVGIGFDHQRRHRRGLSADIPAEHEIAIEPLPRSECHQEQAALVEGLCGRERTAERMGRGGVLPGAKCR